MAYGRGFGQPCFQLAAIATVGTYVPILYFVKVVTRKRIPALATSQQVPNRLRFQAPILWEFGMKTKTSATKKAL